MFLEMLMDSLTAARYEVTRRLSWLQLLIELFFGSAVITPVYQSYL